MAIQPTDTSAPTLPSTTPVAPPEPTAPGRLVLLLCLIATAALWLQHHLGFEISKLGVVVGATTVWTLVGRIAEWLQEKSSVQRAVVAVWRPLRTLTRRASKPGPLALIGLVLAVPVTTLTSITVMSERPVDSAVGVSIAVWDRPDRPSEDSIASGQQLVRFFPVVTNPFGRLFRVDLEGYLPTSFPIYPLVGRRVVLGRDILPVPSVLFRPFVEGISALADSAVFRVTRVGNSGPELLAADSGHVVSFRLGQAQPITDVMIEFWRLQLDAASAPPAERARMLMLWNAPRQLVASRDLEPGDSLIAEIAMRGKVVARAALSVGRDRLVDVLVMDLRR